MKSLLIATFLLSTFFAVAFSQFKHSKVQRLDTNEYNAALVNINTLNGDNAIEAVRNIVRKIFEKNEVRANKLFSY